MCLRVCPFSVAVFFGTAWLVTIQQRQLRKKKMKDTNSCKEKGDDSSAKTGNDDVEMATTPTGTTTKGSGTLPTFHVVFVLGGPGAGKGTQCQLLEERLGWKHLSAGGLLRAERQKGGELGDLINARVKAGALVPSEVTCQLLVNAMMAHYQQKDESDYNNVQHQVQEHSNDKNSNSSDRHTGGGTKFLIDGFPRSKGNLDAWNAMTNTYNNNINNANESTTTKTKTSNPQVEVEFVLCLECPEEVLTGRLLERGKDSGRIDDANLDIIRKRFHTFRQETEPILHHYEERTTTTSAAGSSGSTTRAPTLKRIASDQPIEQVYQQIARLFATLDDDPNS